MEQSFELNEILGSGKSCHPCRERLKKDVEALPDVHSTALTEDSLVLTSATRLHDDISRIGKTIRDQYSHAEWTVEGMDCSGCKKIIETALSKRDGVTSNIVQFMQQKLQVEFEPGKVTAAEIEGVVTKLGYQIRNSSTNKDLHKESCSDSTISSVPIIVTSEKWWKTKKAKHIFVTLALLTLAYLLPFFGVTTGELLFAAVTIVAGYPIAKKAFRAALSGSPFSIEMLMSIAAIGAMFIGAAEEAAMVVLLFEIGEFLEYIATAKARSSIQSLLSLSPQKAFLVEGNTVREVEASELKVGQVTEVRPGGRVATDGIIVHGQSSLDESHLTGESIPVAKEVGSKLFAGSINGDGLLRFTVERTTQDNSLARIIHLVEEAENVKAPAARFVESFSRYYTPLIIVFALMVSIVPPLFLSGEWQTWIYRGLALLLIGCPCALVISVPASITAAISNGARRGLLIKGGAALEAIGSVRIIAFDKTGTLTNGKPVVTNVISEDGTIDEVIALAASVEAGSSHPLASAILRHAEEKYIAPQKSSGHKAIPGKAVSARVAEKEIFVASPKFAKELLPTASFDKVSQHEENGETVVAVVNSTDNKLVGFIALRDEPRPETKAALRDLKGLGIDAVMLTGDNARTGAAIARELGIDVRAELLPEDKLIAIGEMKRNAKVAMAGDGINDAPALAAADVGIAMGAGTEVAIETADAVLAKNSISGVVTLVRLSRSTMKVIRQNVIVALGLKAVFLVTTVGGLTGLWLAVLSDTGATVIVTLNALRLLHEDWMA